MDIKQIRTFLTIAECGSATKASQLLNIVQPAISRQMRMLEDELGAALFLREHSGMELTEAGHALVPHARRVMRELDDARAQIQPADGVTGTVTVGMPSSACELLAGELVAAIKRRHPRVRMRLHSGYGGVLLHSMQAGELDVAIINDPKPTPLIETRFILNEQLFLVGPAGAGVSTDKPLPLSVLKSKPLVLPSAPHAMRSIIEHACELENIALEVVAEVNAMDIQKVLVRSGVGWTVMPSSGVSGELAMGTLSAAPVGGPNLLRHLALCLPMTRRSSPAVRAVTNALLDLIQLCVRDGRWPAATLVEDGLGR